MSNAVGIESRLDRRGSNGGQGGLVSGAMLPALLGAAAKGPFCFEVGARKPPRRTYL